MMGINETGSCSTAVVVVLVCCDEDACKEEEFEEKVPEFEVDRTSDAAPAPAERLDVTFRSRTSGFT